MDRIPTGIPGFDKLIQGGFLPGSVVMLTGSTGTGKTIFGCQFLWTGLSKNEPCMYITLEEPPEDIRTDAMQFGWDFSKYEKKGLLKLEYIDPVKLGSAAIDIGEMVKRHGTKRLVLDSVTILGLAIREPSQIRRRIYNFIRSLKLVGCTSLLISEIPEGSSV
ncbi:MAG: ATPase domain-containing protein, partial [Candidatus Aenigmatarchaeota archaeon]